MASSARVHDELNTEFRSAYTLGEVIASGKFGTVVKVKRNKDDAEFIAKLIHVARCPVWCVAKIDNEATLLKELRHDHIVKISAFFGKGPEKAIVTEMAGGGSVQSYIDSKKVPLSFKNWRDFMFAMLRVMAYLHSKQVTHRAIKADNIFLRAPDKWSDPVIGNFGNAKKTSMRMKELCGTLTHMAPEMFADVGKSVSYNSAVDVWSMGVESYRLYFGDFPESMRDLRGKDTQVVETDPGAVAEVTAFVFEDHIDPGVRLRKELMGSVNAEEDKQVASTLAQMLNRTPDKRSAAATMLEEEGGLFKEALVKLRARRQTMNAEVAIATGRTVMQAAKACAPRSISAKRRSAKRSSKLRTTHKVDEDKKAKDDSAADVTKVADDLDALKMKRKQRNRKISRQTQEMLSAIEDSDLKVASGARSLDSLSSGELVFYMRNVGVSEAAINTIKAARLDGELLAVANQSDLQELLSSTGDDRHGDLPRIAELVRDAKANGIQHFMLRPTVPSPKPLGSPSSSSRRPSFVNMPLASLCCEDLVSVFNHIGWEEYALIVRGTGIGGEEMMNASQDEIVEMSLLAEGVDELTRDRFQQFCIGMQDTGVPLDFVDNLAKRIPNPSAVSELVSPSGLPPLQINSSVGLPSKPLSPAQHDQNRTRRLETLGTIEVGFLMRNAGAPRVADALVDARVDGAMLNVTDKSDFQGLWHSWPRDECSLLMEIVATAKSEGIPQWMLSPNGVEIRAPQTLSPIDPACDSPRRSSKKSKKKKRKHTSRLQPLKDSVTRTASSPDLLTGRRSPLRMHSSNSLDPITRPSSESGKNVFTFEDEDIGSSAPASSPTRAPTPP